MEQWDDDTFDWRHLLVTLWAGRWWIISSTLAFTVAFAAAAMVMTPIYRVKTVLAPAGPDRAGLSGALSTALGSLGGLASLAGVNINSGDVTTEEALAVLRSRQFTESFINDGNLMPELFAKQWDVKTGTWKSDKDEHPTPAQAYKYFDSAIRSVLDNKKTGLVVVQIEWKDRARAASWANELVKRLNAEMRSRAIAKSDASLGFLQKELAATTVVDTRAAINRLIEAQINQRMLASVTQEYAFRVVDRAMAPDKGDVARPNKVMLVLAGMILGSAIGGMVVFFFGRKDSDKWARPRSSPA